MNKRIVGSLLGAVLIGSTTVSAFAESTAPGTPGEPNCEGQSTAFLAQIGQNFGLPIRGIGGFAHSTEFSVREV